jgi:two-component system, sensor histidine kinase
VKSAALRQPTLSSFTFFSRLQAWCRQAEKIFLSPLWFLIGNGRPIRNAMLLLAVIPLVVTVVVLGTIISGNAHDRIESEEGAKVQAEAAFFAQSVEHALSRHLADLESRAALLPKFNLHQDNPQLATWMSTVYTHIADYAWIGFANADGEIQVSTHPGSIGKNARNDKWFQRGSLASGTLGLSGRAVSSDPAILLANSNATLMEITAPVRDANGFTVGVLSGHLRWEWLIRQHHQLTAAFSRDQHAHIVIAGLDGKARLRGIDGQPVLFETLKSFQQAKAGKSGWQRERWPDGQEYVVGYAKANSPGAELDSGWVTLIRVPLADVYRIIDPVISGLWLLIAATVLGFVILTGVLMRITMRPVEKLINDINTVAEHGGVVHSSQRSPREFQVLTRATNQMIKAVRAREAAEQEKTRLIADMSHEIRTPLHGLIGQAEILKARLPNPEDQKDMARLIRCANEMTELVNNALDLSMIEIQKIKLNLEPIMIHELLDFNIELFRSAAKQKNLFLDFDNRIDPNLCLRTDRLRLGQILRNILSNSVKFTQQGGIRVVAKTSRVGDDEMGSPDHGRRFLLELSISDSGVGISGQQQNLLFQRFQQADAAAQTATGATTVGSGLGLSVARGLIESMGGQITLASNAGHGTLVMMKLTLNESMPIPFAAPEGPNDAVAAKLRVLLIDDAKDNRDVMRQWLGLHGHQVWVAGTAAEGIDAAQHATFDLILLDIELPDESGLVVAQTIRQGSSANARATIIAVSGRTLPQDQARSTASGCDGHINKPIDFHAFQHQVRGIGRNTFGSA